MNLKMSQVIFTALADPTRLRIIHLLGEGELCVCDLMKVLREPQSKISRHLSYLRHARLVEARREGLWMYYRLVKQNTKTFQEVIKAMCGSSCDFPELCRDAEAFNRNKKKLVACC